MAGMAKKTNLTNLYCSVDSATPTTCTTCCENDATKCRGVVPQTCGANRVHDLEKIGKTATNTSYDTNCCMDKKKCAADFECPAGQKHKANVTTIMCAASTCGAWDCCENDATKCKGVGAGCGANRVSDPEKDGQSANGTTYDTNCCMAQKKCGADFQCPAGQKAKANMNTTMCWQSFQKPYTCKAHECCDDDATKCKGLMVQCDTGYFKDSTKDGVAANANDFQNKCCTAQATCTTFSTATTTAKTTAKPTTTGAGKTTQVAGGNAKKRATTSVGCMQSVSAPVAVLMYVLSVGYRA
jgi:hypothetical protein